MRIAAVFERAAGRFRTCAGWTRQIPERDYALASVANTMHEHLQSEGEASLAMLFVELFSRRERRPPAVVSDRPVGHPTFQGTPQQLALIPAWSARQILETANHGSRPIAEVQSLEKPPSAASPREGLTPIQSKLGASLVPGRTHAEWHQGVIGLVDPRNPA